MSHQHPDDDESGLLQSARAGDRAALGLLIARHWSCARAVVSAHAAPRDTDDLLQEAFAAAVVSFPAYRGEAHFCAWLIGIVKHKLADHCRRQAHAVSATAFDRRHPPAWAPDCRLDADARLFITACVDDLSERERRVIQLRLVEGLAFKAVADRLHASEDAVKAVYRRAVAKLRAASVID